MSPLLISLIMAAGISGVVYSKFGPRLGYGNAQNVWMVTGIAFILVFLVFFTLMKFVLELE